MDQKFIFMFQLILDKSAKVTIGEDDNLATHATEPWVNLLQNIAY